jgi:hypothetical protein
MGKPIGSYGDKQTTTKLGGMASPEQKANTEETSGSIYKSVKKRSLKDILPSKSTLGSYGNKKTTTKLGGIASPEQAASTLKVEKQKAMKDDVIASVTANVPALNVAFTDYDAIDNVAVSMKIQEAFQRALLSARIANDAKAKVFKSLPKYRKASLSQVVPSQTRPTLSQQKAFANSNRRTSLFPEKFVSHLSRLLQK